MKSIRPPLMEVTTDASAGIGDPGGVTGEALPRVPITQGEDAEKHLAQMEGKRRLMEEELQESEERYRILIDAIQDYAIFMMDPGGQIVSWNAGAERIKGYSADEIMGHNFSCFFPSEDIERGRPEQILRMTAASGRHEEQSMRVRKDGSRFLASVTFTALRDAAGNLRGFSEFSHDLSESKESGAKYRGLLEAAPDAMVVVNQHGEIMLLNLQAEKQFGYRRDELVGQKVKNIIPEGFAERLIADGTRTAADALAQQIGTGIELIGRRKDGSDFPIEIMLSPLASAEGILVTAAIRDISVRKAAEKHLAQMEGRYRGLLEAAPDAMVVVNQHGEIVLLNVQAEKQFGYRRDELVGQKVKNIIPEGFAERLLADGLRSAADALVQQIGTGIELTGRRKDGSEFPIEIMLSPLESAEGILVTAAIRNISVRKAAEKQLALLTDENALQKQLQQAVEQAKEAADTANRAKSTFLAVVSHEIRTPLFGVLGMLELLSLTELDADQRRTLSLVLASGTSLQEIIDDILDFSKIEAGKLELTPAANSIREIVDSTHHIYCSNASSKGLLLTCDVDPEISAALLVDPLRLGQILNNFVSNAIKFTSAGRIEIKAKLLDRVKGRETVCFSVTDSGVGISPEAQARLFQPFVQASGDTAQQHGGTGLGLAICKRLADVMGGAIEMESQVGAGTTMTLSVSLPIADPKDLVRSDVQGAQNALIAGLGSRRTAPDVDEAARERTLVLLVDDHPINRELLCRQINASGYAVESAENGIEALAMWKSGRFALVITDGNMPAMDGYELTRAIRKLEASERRERIPIVACTANVLADAAGACFAAGMDDYLSKPVGLAELSKKLDRWMPLSAASRTRKTDDKALQPSKIKATPGGAAVDQSVLADICGGDATVEREILLDFRRVNDAAAADLRGAVTRTDLVQVIHVSHRIKGSCGMLGAGELSNVCERIERASRAADWKTIVANMTAFEDAIDRVNAYIDSMPPVVEAA